MRLRGGTVAARRWLLVATVAMALLAGACSSDASSDDESADDAADTTASTTTSIAAAEVEAFTGTVDEFYEVPDPLPPGEPGQLIRTMPIDEPAGERTGVRIMYHSTDGEGDDRAVTGVVYHPTTEAPDDGWPVLAWAHGTSGLGPQCAPSRRPDVPPDFGVDGVLVATDYIGLGPEGELHPYLSAAAEGHAVIDGVAAARSLPDAHAGDEWVLAGLSQGGHAVLVTNEMAAERLPDAELLGAVAVAPGSQLGESYGDDIQTGIITTMVLYGAAADDPSIDPSDYLSPAAYDAAEAVVHDECLGEIIAAMLPYAGRGEIFDTDPRGDALGEAWLEANDPGQVVSESPLLVVQGGQDVIVVPARTDALVERLCGIGQVVERVDVPDADHETITGRAQDQIAAWLAARLAGEPATDGC